MTTHHRFLLLAMMTYTCPCSPLSTTAYSHTQSYHRRTSSFLLMKRPNPSKEFLLGPQIPADDSTDLPANLKRQLVAKRPVLGHVVPKQSPTRNRQKVHAGSTQRGGSNSAILRPQGQNRDTIRYNNPSILRILGGSIKGRKLESPNVYLRPMMGKVREAVFSTFICFGLYDHPVGGRGCTTRHLDIFSGSGSVGLESLSRGASHCTFVDMSSDCCETCERNIEHCGFTLLTQGALLSGDVEQEKATAKVFCADAFRALNQPESVGIDPTHTFDIVTLCPPYEEIVYADLLRAVANSQLVTDDTLILIEYPVELGSLPHVITREDGGKLVGVRNRKYGRTVISMYIVNPSGARDKVESRPEEFLSLL